MSKTTPEEALRLAEKHGLILWRRTGVELAALIDEVREQGTEPVGFVHPSTLRLLESGTNCAMFKPGHETEGSIALYTHPPAKPAAPMVDMGPPATSRDRWMYEQGRLAERDPRTPKAVPVELPVVAWLEHHKGGDNLNWEQVDHPYAKADALVKLSDAQAAISAAGRKAS